MLRKLTVVLATTACCLTTWAGVSGAASANDAVGAVNATPTPSSAPMTCPPALPVGGQASAVTETTITISYYMLLTPPCGYNPPVTITLFTSRENATQWLNPVAEAVSGLERNGTVTVTGLTPNTDYWFRFSADGKHDPYFTGGPVRTAAHTTCTATATIDNKWNGGFVSTVTVRNTGTEAITGWNVSWHWTGDERISGLWNGVPSGTGADVTVRNATYNGTLAPGASTTFGMMVWASNTSYSFPLTCSRVS